MMSLQSVLDTKKIEDFSADHDYIDVSYHGSPDWECRFCHKDKYDIIKNSETECLNARISRKSEYDHQVRQEYSDYLRAKSQFLKFIKDQNKFEPEENILNWILQ